MHVQLALFDGDDLLERVKISVSASPTSERFGLFTAHHQVIGDSAEILLDAFPPALDIDKVDIDMPLHESGDWETLDIGKYTLAFWCRIGV